MNEHPLPKYKNTVSLVGSPKVGRQRIVALPGQMRSSRCGMGVKALLDVLVATVLLIALSPLLALVVLAVKLQDGGAAVVEQRAAQKFQSKCVRNGFDEDRAVAEDLPDQPRERQAAA